MKAKHLYFLASMALLPLASCTDEVQELATQQQELKQIVMTTEDFQPEAGSRTLYEIADGAVKCTWATNDTVGVFPDKGAQVYFPMASGAGTKNATFDGEGWALKDGRTYGAYYPFIGKMYLDKESIPVSYTGQAQTGNGSVEHLGAYDYMVASPVAPEFGSAKFLFRHLSALVQLRLTVPQPATLTSVKLVADTEAFAVEGTVDIMADSPSIASKTSASEVELKLQDVTTTEENQVVTLYLMIPPVDLSEQTLKAVVVSDKGNQEVALERKNFQAGRAYGLSAEMESTEAGYKDGVVTLSEAGTMKELLGNNWLNITSLKAVGPINGDDVSFLRQMLGASNVNESERGKLAVLDLSEVSIVEGGNYWFEDSPSATGEGLRTSNNVIGAGMFYQCYNLQHLVLPKYAISIDWRAFMNCIALTSIDIPHNITSIGKEAFSGCFALTSISLPNTITTIGNKTFMDCPSLVSITLPNTITSIGILAFGGCSSLISIEIPNSVTWIGSSAFSNCSSLTSINLPNDITSVNSYVFEECSSLTSVYLPDGIVSIGSHAFYFCSSLVSINIPNGISSIGDYAFYRCNSLTSINIPNSVTSIKKGAFGSCYSLSSVTIGNSVTSIGDYAFSSCRSLTEFFCHSITPPQISTGSKATFDSYGDQTSLHVPTGCSSKYQSSVWNSYFTNVVEME